MNDNCNCMVSVFCTTYNQKKYISQCLNSLVNQITTFNYEIIVRDDASTDGTSDIVRAFYEKYPDKIVPMILSENHFQRGLSHISYEKMFNMSRGKYIAICEGDDFWTDETKLQKQVDFMESHPEHSLCGHAAYYALENGEYIKDRLFQFDTQSRDLSVEEIITNWAMATCSLLYRKSCRTDIIVPFKGKCINGDYALMVYLALKGKVYYINECMGAYRVCSNGSLSQMRKNNTEYLKETRLEYINMLDRIDDYTHKKYSDIILLQKKKNLFDLYLNLGDRKNLRHYKDIYKISSTKTKIRYIICMYFHPIYKPVYNIYAKWKNQNG